jgi:hypothetical protein
MELLLTFFGGILVLVAVVGGGFEIKEVKMPRVGWFARLPALALGLVFVAMGVAGLASSGSSSELVDPPPVETSASPPVVEPPPEVPPVVVEDTTIVFTVTDTLGTGQWWEELTLYIEGEEIGTLYVDGTSTDDYINVEAPGPGTYSYELMGSSEFEEYYCDPTAGSGTIEVVHGGTYAVYAASDDGCTVELV